MSDLILVEDVNNIINNINEDNKSYKSEKSYNIDYDINDRLKFLQNKYKDYEFKINSRNNKLITYRKKRTKTFRHCCINFDCITNPSFCKIDETKPTHCKDCSLLSDYTMECFRKDLLCILCKKTRACFCIEGETKATHCKNCSLEVEEKENIEFVNINAPKCIKCNEKYPTFCIEDGTKATHCKACSLEVEEKENIEMIDIANKSQKCIVCKKTRANFCIEGGTKATYCSSCSQIISLEKNIEMEDINNKKKKCKNIIDGIQCKTQAQLEKYDGYCSQCYFKINPTKIPIINRKIKENAVVEFIKLIYTQEIREKLNIKDIIFDKPCGNTKKKPDIVIICENNVIIIEVDEFQHKKNRGHYSKENEENKMDLIRDYYKSINKKTIYIRFNPDDYLSKDNKKIKSPWKENEDKLLVVVDETDWKNRLQILKKKIDYYLKKKEIKKDNKPMYLFYDGYKL